VVPCGRYNRAALMSLWPSDGGLGPDRESGRVLTPYAAEDIEHNTNIFDLPKSGGAPVGKNGSTFADTFFDTRAGVEGTYLLDQQKFFGRPNSATSITTISPL